MKALKALALCLVGLLDLGLAASCYLGLDPTGECMFLKCMLLGSIIGSRLLGIGIVALLVWQTIGTG